MYVVKLNNLCKGTSFVFCVYLFMMGLSQSSNSKQLMRVLCLFRVLYFMLDYSSTC